MNENKKVSFWSKLRSVTAWRIGFTVSVVALVLVLNILFSVIAQNALWYVDMTKNRITQIEEAVAELEKQTADYYKKTGVQVAFRAIFCLPRDRALQVSGGQYVVRCLEEFESKLSNFSIAYYDVAADPSLVASYRATMISAISADRVILEAYQADSDPEVRIGFRVHSYNAFYTFDTEGKTYAFNGEYTVASTTLALIAKAPVAAFVTGHGEQVTSEPGKDGLAALCKEVGFENVVVDLRTEDLPADTQVIIINNPTSDYGAVELRKVEKYVNNGGNIILFMDPIAQDLSYLEELAKQYGVSFRKGSYVKDAENALAEDSFHFAAVYDTTQREDEEKHSYVDAPGAQLTAELRAMESTPKTIFKNACAMDVLMISGTQYQSGRNWRDVTDIFQTSTSGFVAGMTQPETLPLMTWSMETIIHNDRDYLGTYTYSYQLVSGCTDYTAYEYLQTNAYGNNDVLQNALGNMRVRIATSSIGFRVLDKQNLSINDENDALQTVWMITTVVCVLGVITCGTVVHIRRKYR